jgi:hypothetical protein
MERAVKAQLSLMILFFLYCTGLPALGQEAGMNAPTYSNTLNAAPAAAERPLQKDSDQTSGNIATALSDHLVVFESRRDTEQKRLAIPFTAFANSPLHVAYDPASRQMMAQWKFDSPKLIGQTLQYQAYVDATGALSFVFSARF